MTTSITNLSTDVVGVPLYGVGAVEPGSTVDVDDNVADALSDHPGWKVTASSAVPSVTVSESAAASDTAVAAPSA